MVDPPRDMRTVPHMTTATMRTTPGRSGGTGAGGTGAGGRAARRIPAVLRVAAAILLIAASPASAQQPDPGARTGPADPEAIEAAAERAELVGRLFGDSAAGDILRTAAIRQLTSPAPLPPAPTVISDPGQVDMISSWNGTLEIEALSEQVQQQVDTFVRRSGILATGNPGSGSGASPSRTGLVCPIEGPVRFINDWGYPRSGGRRHQGNDLFALEGTPVVAVLPSIVVSVSRVDVGLGGLHVSYVDVNGDRWYNAHLLSVQAGIEPGVEIAAGQRIGYVGRSGNARTTPPHNHIQWHPGGGGPVNPYPILRPACP